MMSTGSPGHIVLHAVASSGFDTQAVCHGKHMGCKQCSIGVRDAAMGCIAVSSYVVISRHLLNEL